MKGRALVAWNLRRLRVARGLSQERLAYDAEIDRSYVGSLERKEQNPTIDVLEKLCRTLNVDLIELFAVPAKETLAPRNLKAGRKKKSGMRKGTK
jgi:transcriptional regulator with XRE-family HTH domain